MVESRKTLTFACCVRDRKDLLLAIGLCGSDHDATGGGEVLPETAISDRILNGVLSRK
jgi:hypothetical protein